MPGDLAVRGALADQRQHLSLARGQRHGPSAADSKTVIPRATIRTAIATSAARQSFETKPAAPATSAAAGEILPAPEISRTAVAGEMRRISSQRSAPDSRGTGRPARRAGPPGDERESLLELARGQAARDPDCSESRSRKPQWTTSWSSATSTANSCCGSGARHRQNGSADPFFSEPDDAAPSKGLEGLQPQADPAPPGCPGSARRMCRWRTRGMMLCYAAGYIARTRTRRRRPSRRSMCRPPRSANLSRLSFGNRLGAVRRSSSSRQLAEPAGPRPAESSSSSVALVSLGRGNK